MAIDYETPLGQVRLLISDVNDAEPILTDTHINGFLGLNGENVRRAAADALDAIASSEALVSKAIRTQDLQTDGAKVADALRKHADRLRAQADAEMDDDGFVFDIVAPNTGARRPELKEYDQAWGM
jgi:hypothetical protein